ncbi:unnamed protein product [Leptosia nina]|uniref:Uncharacterized protein n=1 Tax=Leptosia nina TaxID=320188 RepID=A0AAV1JJX3_9NEOP
MSNIEPKKRIKKTKQKTSLTCYSDRPVKRVNLVQDTVEHFQQNSCSLIAKDSEWVDILGNSSNSSRTDDSNTPAGEIIVQDDESYLEPLTLMFPNLLQEDPETLQGIVNKAISTTEVTKHLIGHKANFSFLKKVDRLIPPERQWLEHVSESSKSYESINSLSSKDECPTSCCTGNHNDKL